MSRIFKGLYPSLGILFLKILPETIGDLTKDLSMKMLTAA